MAKSLVAHQAERDALLLRISRMAQADPRIVAAWLFGSLGRGTADALSDLDVWLVVQDAHVRECVARRRVTAAAVGEPVLFLEAPQNAPRSGGYLMACYDGPTAPHQVDWYWQPESFAHVPAETRLLFDRVGLPSDPAPTRLVAGDARGVTVEEPLNSISFFWAMLMICAKAIHRAPDGEAPLLRYVLGALRRVQAVFGVAPTHARATNTAGAATATSTQLRDLGQEMQALMPRAARLGMSVPERAAPAALRYIDFVEDLPRI